MPAYRAELTLEATFRDLPHDVIDKTLLVDDASSDDTVAVARRLGIRPHIGVRAKLTTRGAGKWIDSTGDRSKFGLFTTEILELVEVLRDGGPLGGVREHGLQAHEQALGAFDQRFDGFQHADSVLNGPRARAGSIRGALAG